MQEVGVFVVVKKPDNKHSLLNYSTLYTGMISVRVLLLHNSIM